MESHEYVHSLVDEVKCTIERGDENRSHGSVPDILLEITAWFQDQNRDGFRKFVWPYPASSWKEIKLNTNLSNIAVVSGPFAKLYC